MKNRNLAFIDLETTGLDVTKHEIIQIGCVLVRQIEQENKGPELEVIEEFEYKVTPDHIETADPVALKINGYNFADWLFAVTLKNALIELSKKVDGAVMVGHNVAFDNMFLEKAFRDTGVINTMDYHKLDTIAIAYACLYNSKEPEKFSLRALSEYFNIENKNAHTALSDARTAFEIYKKLLVK